MTTDLHEPFPTPEWDRPNPLVARRPPRSRIAVLVALVALAAVATACPSPAEQGSSTSAAPTAPSSTKDPGTVPTASGSDPAPVAVPDLDDAGTAYADALASIDQRIDAEQERCLVATWVQAIGVDAFIAAEVTPEDLASEQRSIVDVGIDDDTANLMAAGFADCGIDLVDYVLTGAASGGIRNHATEACLETSLTDASARSMFVEAVTGAGSPTYDALIDACPGAGQPPVITGLTVPDR